MGGCLDAPSAIPRLSALVGASLVGDSALYVVLPVVFRARGLSPMQVGVILSANRWTRLFTNAPAARLLGISPVRIVFASALLVGGLCSFLYCSKSLVVLVVARCIWGGCWSILRLTGMLTVTDCIEAEMASESDVGRLTGLFGGLIRLGSAFGMAAGGVVSDRLSFEGFFTFAGLLTASASPFALACTFGMLPRISVTASSKLAQKPSPPSSRAQGPCRCRMAHCHRNPCQLTRVQLQLLALAFSASCAGDGMIVSTLGMVLASYSNTDASTGERILQLGAGMQIGTATLNGVLLGSRWALEGFGAPLIGRMVDRVGWTTVAPTVFGLSCLNGAVGFALLQTAEMAGSEASGLLLAAILCSILLFFALAATADLCVKAMGVSWRETTLLVQGNDLGAAMGPVLGYALIQVGLPPSAVLAAQSAIHGGAALVALSAARLHARVATRPQGGTAEVERAVGLSPQRLRHVALNEVEEELEPEADAREGL